MQQHCLLAVFMCPHQHTAFNDMNRRTGGAEPADGILRTRGLRIDLTGSNEGDFDLTTGRRSGIECGTIV